MVLVCILDEAIELLLAGQSCSTSSKQQCRGTVLRGLALRASDAPQRDTAAHVAAPPVWALTDLRVQHRGSLVAHPLAGGRPAGLDVGDEEAARARLAQQLREHLDGLAAGEQVAHGHACDPGHLHVVVHVHQLV